MFSYVTHLERTSIDSIDLSVKILLKEFASAKKINIAKHLRKFDAKYERPQIRECVGVHANIIRNRGRVFKFCKHFSCSFTNDHTG